MKPAIRSLHQTIVPALAASIALVSAHASPPVLPTPPPSEWTGGALNGLWTASGNWASGIPNSSAVSAKFGPLPAVPTAVFLDGGKTAGGILFDNANAYTITGGIAEILTLDHGAAAVEVAVLSGNHHIGANITLSSDLLATAAAGSALTFDGEISGTKSLTSSGAVALTSPTHHTGPTRVATGTLALSGDATLDGSASIRVESAAKLDVEDVDGLFPIQTGQTLLNLGEFRGNLDVFGTLGGSGLQTGVVYLNDEGHLAPGDGVGTLTLATGLEFSDGGALDFQLGNTSDLLRVIGGTFVGCGLAGVTVHFSTGPAFIPGEYVLIDWTGAGALGVDATDFKVGTLEPGLQAGFKVVNQTVVVNIVPEPGSIVLAGCGFFGILGTRRRRA